MRRVIAAAALALALAPGPAAAQDGGAARLTPEQLRTVAQFTLRSGDVGRAVEMAQALTRRDPDDAAARVTLAEAAVALGQWDWAVREAGRAWRNAEPGPLAFASARLAALAHSQLGQDTRAQFWLRRARQHAPDPLAARAVAEDYRFLRMRNPWTFSLRFGLAPSSNVNGGSANDTTRLFDLPFDFRLSGDAQALSGLQISAGGEVSYRLRADDRSATFVTLDLDGRTYVLSDEAREQAPDAKGSDYARLRSEIGVEHRWAGAEGGGPYRVALTATHLRYGGEAFTRSLRGEAGGQWEIGEDNAIALGASLEWQERLQDDETVPNAGLNAALVHRLDNGDRLRLSGALRRADTDLADVGHDSRIVGIGWDKAEPVMGLALGFEASMEWREFTDTAYSTETREDRTLGLRAEIGLTDLEWYGFSPVATLEARHTESTIDLYDSEELSGGLTLRSSF